MRRIAAIAIAVAVCAALASTGCDKNKIENVSDDSANSMFVIVEECSSWIVMYDKETGVMYEISKGLYNHGNFTLLVDEEGKPKVYHEKVVG